MSNDNQELQKLAAAILSSFSKEELQEIDEAFEKIASSIQEDPEYMEKQAAPFSWLIKALTKAPKVMGKNTGTFGQWLKTIPANALADTQNWLIRPWLTLFRKGGELVHGKENVAKMGLYKWMTKLRRQIDIDNRNVQRLNNQAAGYGYLSNRQLKVQRKWNPATGKFEAVRGANGKLVANPEHYNWHLGRQFSRMAPGLAAVGGIEYAGHELEDSDNKWISGAGTALKHLDPFRTVPTLAMYPVKGIAHAAAPFIQDYYQNKYYDTPPNLLGHAYKLFNPGGYHQYVREQAKSRINDYLDGRSGGAIVRDIFTGQLGNKDTPKNFDEAPS